MKTRTRDRESLYFKMKFEEGYWRADSPDEENETEIVANLHEESDFQIEKEDDLTDHVCSIYMHKLSLVLVVVPLNNLSCFCQKRFAMESSGWERFKY